MTDILLLVLIILVLRLMWQLGSIAEMLLDACGFLQLITNAAVGQPAVDSQSNADQPTSTESTQP